MPTTIESSGKTLDEAIRSGLSVLGVEREAVTVEILSKPKTGFFGIGSTLAKVKLTLSATEKPANKPINAARSAPVTAPAPARQPARPAPAQSAQPAQPARAAQSPARPAAARPPRPVRQPQPEAQQRKRTPRPTSPATEENYKTAVEFVSGLLKFIDMGMTATTSIEDGIIKVNLDGENVGNLIGRHGETLDAIQHLVTNAVNMKNDGVTVRVQVDAADYRRKRQEALEQLARRMAENAKKYNSNMTLEPMNAYERHIIHVTLQEVQGIVTFSTGTEPQRRVVISTASRQRRDDRPPRDNRNRPRDNDRGRRDDRRPREDRPQHDGHKNNTRPASQAFRSPGGTAAAPRAQSAQAPAPTTASSALSAPSAPSVQSTPPAPRTLPVKEFGIKKS